MLNETLNAILLGFGLAFMVGPVFFTLIETSISKGVRAAIVFDLGVFLADITFIIIAYFGSVGLFNQIQSDQRFFWFGGIILIVFGIYTIYKKKKVAGIENTELKVPENNKYLQLLLKGFFLNFINVGVLAFWFAVVIAVSSNFQLNERKIIQHFVIVMVTIFLVDLVKIVVAKQLKSRLTPAVLNKIQITLGVFFIIFGLGLIVKQFVAI